MIKVRNDLSFFYEGQFESIFLEVMCGKTSTVVGEVCRIPNTNDDISIECYENVTSCLRPHAQNIILGTDENFHYLNLNDHRSTSYAFDTFISNGIVPCINRPTRVTHSSATLIEFIPKCQFFYNCCSGILISHLSDHFPMIACVGSKPCAQTSKTTFTARFIGSNKLELHQFIGYTCRWGIYNLYYHDNYLDTVAPEITISIPPHKLRREPCSLGSPEVLCNQVRLQKN